MSRKHETVRDKEDGKIKVVKATKETGGGDDEL
jgi:hypothetical protein